MLPSSASTQIKLLSLALLSSSLFNPIVAMESCGIPSVRVGLSSPLWKSELETLLLDQADTKAKIRQRQTKVCKTEPTEQKTLKTQTTTIKSNPLKIINFEYVTTTFHSITLSVYRDVMTILHGSSTDFSFTTTFIKCLNLNTQS